MRQSRGRGSKVETEARPCEAEARPSPLKKLPRGRLEPREIILIIIIIIRAFVRRTMSASVLNLRRRQSLGGEDGEG